MYRATIKSAEDLLVAMEFFANAESYKSRVEELKQLLTELKAAKAEYAEVSDLVQLKERLQKQEALNTQKLADAEAAIATAKTQVRTIIEKARAEGKELTKVDTARQLMIQHREDELTAAEKQMTNAKLQLSKDQADLSERLANLDARETEHAQKVHAFINTVKGVQ